MIKVKQNVLELMKENGFSTYRLRKEKIMGESRIQRIRHGELPSWHELEIICKLTSCDIGDIIVYLPE